MHQPCIPGDETQASGERRVIATNATRGRQPSGLQAAGPTRSVRRFARPSFQVEDERDYFANRVVPLRTGKALAAAVQPACPTIRSARYSASRHPAPVHRPPAFVGHGRCDPAERRAKADASHDRGDPGARQVERERQVGRRRLDPVRRDPCVDRCLDRGVGRLPGHEVGREIVAETDDRASMSRRRPCRRRPASAARRRSMSRPPSRPETTWLGMSRTAGPSLCRSTGTSCQPMRSSHSWQSRPRDRREMRGAAPTARCTSRPRAIRSSAICAPDRPLPTTSTAPGGSGPGSRSPAAVNWPIAAGRGAASPGTTGVC